MSDDPRYCPTCGGLLRYVNVRGQWSGDRFDPATGLAIQRPTVQVAFLECPRNRWHDHYRYYPDVEHIEGPGRTRIAGEWRREPSHGQRFWRSGERVYGGPGPLGLAYRWFRVRVIRK